MALLTKRPPAIASSPRLGRKRPQRAAVTRSATASRQNEVRRTNCKCKINAIGPRRWHRPRGGFSFVSYRFMEAGIAGTPEIRCITSCLRGACTGKYPPRRRSLRQSGGGGSTRSKRQKITPDALDAGVGVTERKASTGRIAGGLGGVQNARRTFMMTHK
jgi:hypothetical protein